MFISSRLHLESLNESGGEYLLDFSKGALDGPDFQASLADIQYVLWFRSGDVGLQLLRGPVLKLKKRRMAPWLFVLRLSIRLGLGFNGVRDVDVRSYLADVHAVLESERAPELKLDLLGAVLREGFASLELFRPGTTYHPKLRGQLVFDRKKVTLFNSFGEGMLLTDLSLQPTIFQDTRFRDEDDHPQEDRSWTEYLLSLPTTTGRRLTLTYGGRKSEVRFAALDFGDRLIRAVGLPPSRLEKSERGIPVGERASYTGESLFGTSASGGLFDDVSPASDEEDSLFDS